MIGLAVYNELEEGENAPAKTASMLLTADDPHDSEWAICSDRQPWQEKSVRETLENVLEKADAIVKTSRKPAYAEFIANYDRAEEVDEILAHISIPTTIVWGTEDRIFPLICAHDFHIGIPNSRLILLPGVNHNTHMGAAKKITRIMLEDIT